MVPLIQFDDNGKKIEKSKKKKEVGSAPPAPWLWKDHPKILNNNLLWGEMVKGELYHGEGVKRRLTSNEIHIAKVATDMAFKHLRTKYVVEDGEEMIIMGLESGKQLGYIRFFNINTMQ